VLRTERATHRRLALTGVGLVVIALFGWFSITAAGAATADAAENELTAAKAVVLGLVEGITEYLPISSTGHLHVAQQLMDVGTTDETKDAADTYAITIQLGAILAVLVLYWRRILDVVQGLLGRSESGRRILVALAIAFAPAAITGVLFDDAIKDNLLRSGPIAAAWFVGALAIWFLAPRLRENAMSGTALELITTRQAAGIGAAQILALWPGTSRSLVTILAAMAVGLSIAAAVEFSFLLGLLTLGAATFYDGAKSGGEMIDTFGLAKPVLGMVVAFVSAVVAVRWMVSYLERRGLEIFAIYRVAAAFVVVGLLATDVL
jgi:undecaprenyl-diphosphatase